MRRDGCILRRSGEGAAWYEHEGWGGVGRRRAVGWWMLTGLRDELMEK